MAQSEEEKKENHRVQPPREYGRVSNCYILGTIWSRVNMEGKDLKNYFSHNGKFKMMYNTGDGNAFSSFKIFFFCGLNLNYLFN